MELVAGPKISVRAGDVELVAGPKIRVQAGDVELVAGPKISVQAGDEELVCICNLIKQYYLLMWGLLRLSNHISRSNIKLSAQISVLGENFDY